MRALLGRAWRARHSEHRGQILVMFGLSFMLFLGFAALAVDIGFLLLTQRSYQNAADEAALAGAVYLTRPISDPCADTSGGGSKHDCARAAAWRYLDADLDLVIDDAFIDTNFRGMNTPAAGELVSTNAGGQQYRIWVSTPPITAGDSSLMSTVRTQNQVIFVRVDRMRSPFIAGVMGIGDLNVSAWATAGIFPNRFAVITLRRGKGSAEIDPGPANTTDIRLAGTGSSLNVVDGDVGGNWGMKLTAGSRLRMSSSGSDEVNTYLIDYISCGNSCWTSGQIERRIGPTGPWVSVEPKRLPSYVPDPNYPAPPIRGATWPNGLVNNLGNTPPDIPNGDTDTSPYSGPPPNIRIRQGTVTASGRCVGPDGTADTAPRLGPGTYGDIRVDTRNCVILDPVRTFSDPEAGLDGATSPGPEWSWVPSTQAPGIYYVTGNFDVQTDALIVGDGVTVIMRPPGTFQPSGGGAMDLNRGLVVPGDQRLGAWTTKGQTPYVHNSTRWEYDPLGAFEADKRLYGVGIAMYVLKPSQSGVADANGTDTIDVSSGSALAWNGITYAPHDNVKIAGQPNHDGIGQLVSYTFTFNGGTDVTQTFDGPGDGFPYLIEPCVVVAGSCQ